jgi:hypothetical protein
MWIVRERYMQELVGMEVREHAIHRRLSRMIYSRRCAEASAMKAYLEEVIADSGHGDSRYGEGCQKVGRGY